MQRTQVLIGLTLMAMAFVSCAHSKVRTYATWDGEALRPAASDARSLLVPWPEHDHYHGYHCWEPPSTLVSSDDVRSVRGLYAQPGPQRDGHGPTLFSLCGAQTDCLVVADAARGVRTVDLRTPAAPRTSDATALSSRPDVRFWSVGRAFALHASEQLALVATRADEQAYTLWWFALEREAPPRLLHHVQGQGALRGSHRLPGAALTVALIVDESAGGPCSDRTGTSIHIASPDSPAPKLAASLGPDVTKVHGIGEILFVARGNSSEVATTLSMLTASSQGVTKLGVDIPIGRGWEALHRQGDQLRVVWGEHSMASQIGEFSSFRTQIAHIDLSDDATQPKVHGCDFVSFAQSPRTRGTMPAPPVPQRVLFLRDRTLLTFDGLSQGAPHTGVSLTPDCRQETEALPASFLLASSNESTLLAFAPSEGTSLSAWRVPANNGPMASRAPDITLSVEVDPALPMYSVMRSQMYLGGGSIAVVKLGPELDGISIPYQEFDKAGQMHRGSQLLALSSSELRVAERLESTLWLADDPARAVSLDAAGVVISDLRDSMQVKQLYRMDLFQTHAKAIIIDNGIARLRWPSPSGELDPLAQNVMGQLELVADGEHPQTGRASAVLPVEGRAELYRVGQRLVTIAQDIGVENRPTRSCVVRVFDTHNLAQARQLAMFTDDVLCSQQHALADQPAHVAGATLVFARTESTWDGPHKVTAQQLALFALDLRDPAHPVLRGPFRTPKGEWPVALEVKASRLRQVYRVDARTTPAKDSGEVHYYQRLIAFDEPDAPTLGSSISLAGEPILYDGEHVYTRDVVAGPGGPRFLLRRLRLSEDAAEVEVSRDMQAESILSLLALDGNRLLLAQAAAPRTDYHASVTVRPAPLLVLDASTLKNLSSTEVTLRVSPKGFSTGNGAWLYTREGNLARISIDASHTPRVDDVIWEAELQDRGNGQLLWWRAGVLRRTPEAVLP